MSKQTIMILSVASLGSAFISLMLLIIIALVGYIPTNEPPPTWWYGWFTISISVSLGSGLLYAFMQYWQET